MVRLCESILQGSLKCPRGTPVKRPKIDQSNSQGQAFALPMELLYYCPAFELVLQPSNC